MQSPTAKFDVAGDIKAANIYSNGKLLTPPECFGSGKLLQYRSTTGWSCTNTSGSTLPSVTLSHTCNGVACTTVKPGDLWGANWTTTNTTELSFICNGPTGYAQNGKKQIMPLQMSNNFQTYDQLLASGWVAGAYKCTWTMV
jgi:hypothetical protein